MSSRWPQGQQDPRSPYATHEGDWSQDDGSDQPWQDDGWQAQDQSGYGDQPPSPQGSARPAGRAAQAVAEPRAPQRQRSGGRAAGEFQREWDQSGGGFGDDEDLEWISYLTGGGGGSVQPKPDQDPPERRPSRQERSRSRRGRGRSAQTDPGPELDRGGIGPPPISAPFPAQPPSSRQAPVGRAAPDQTAATNPGRALQQDYGRDAAPQQGYGRTGAPDSGYGQAATEARPAARRSRHGRGAEVEHDPVTDPGYSRRAAADPRNDQQAAPGWPAAANSGYQLPTLADTQYGQAAAAADTQYGQPAAAADTQYGQAPAADPQYGHTAPRAWSPAADPGYDQAALAGWPAVAEPRHDAVAEPRYDALAQPRHDHAAAPEPTGWPETTDPRFGQGSVAGWHGADSGGGQGSVAGWPSVDSGYDQAAQAGWPVVAEPRRDALAQPRHDDVAEAEPTGWPEATDPRFDPGSVAGWPSVDTGYNQAALAGWPAVAEPQHHDVAEAEPTGWPEPDAASPQPDFGSTAGWRAEDTGYGQAATNGWPAAESAFVGQAPDDSGYAQPATAAWPPAVDEQDPAAEAAAPAPARQRTARKSGKQAPAKKRASARAGTKTAPRTQPQRLLADPEPGEQPLKQGRRPKLGGRRMPMKVLAIAGAAAVVAGGAGAVLVFSKSAGGPDHTVSTPTTLGAFTKQPQLAVQMRAAALRQQIISESAGEAHNVVYAVYQDGSTSGGSSGPQIILFIGGNLSGTSAGSFISTFTGKLQGAVTTSPGSLGGAAACVPSVDGRVAECVWADNDTFGVVASQTLGPAGLANEMRQMRPLVEHVDPAN
jgi:hypothetical protein